MRLLVALIEKGIVNLTITVNAAINRDHSTLMKSNENCFSKVKVASEALEFRPEIDRLLCKRLSQCTQLFVVHLSLSSFFSLHAATSLSSWAILSHRKPHLANYEQVNETEWATRATWRCVACFASGARRLGAAAVNYTHVRAAQPIKTKIIRNCQWQTSLSSAEVQAKNARSRLSRSHLGAFGCKPAAVSGHISISLRISEF